MALCARPVNSGVRFLLKGKSQESGSIILNLIEAVDLSCVLMKVVCSESGAKIKSGRGSFSILDKYHHLC